MDHPCFGPSSPNENFVSVRNESAFINSGKLVTQGAGNWARGFKERFQMGSVIQNAVRMTLPQVLAKIPVMATGGSAADNARIDGMVGISSMLIFMAF